MKRTKITGILTAIAMTVPLVLTSCGQKGNDASEDTTFSWWLYSGPDASYYTEYTENPAIQYTLDKTWGEENKTLSFEFWQPASGTARDNYTTMIASGDLPDIIDAVVSAVSYTHLDVYKRQPL